MVLKGEGGSCSTSHEEPTWRLYTVVVDYEPRGSTSKMLAVGSAPDNQFNLDAVLESSLSFLAAILAFFPALGSRRQRLNCPIDSELETTQTRFMPYGVISRNQPEIFLS